MKRLASLVICLSLSFAAHADVQTLLQMVDYMGVDYAGAVSNGAVTNDSEYAEMQEFAGRIQSEINGLGQNPAKTQLSSLAEQLKSQVTSLAEPSVIAGQTQAIRQLLMSNYDIVLTPRGAPDLARAKELYSVNCASCHGENGYGDGPAAVNMDPAPTNFHDTGRERQRSLFGLYNTITLGVEGTPMPSWQSLPPKHR